MNEFILESIFTLLCEKAGVNPDRRSEFVLGFSETTNFIFPFQEKTMHSSKVKLTDEMEFKVEIESINDTYDHVRLVKARELERLLNSGLKQLLC